MSENQDPVHKRFEIRGMSREQTQQIQQLAAQMASQQVQRAMQATSNFITTVVALVSSALGFVAALAWNNAIQTWLASIDKVSVTSVEGEFIYALVATGFAIIVILILGFITSRIFKQGKNLITSGN